MTNEISVLQGKRLLSLARDTIGYRLGIISEVNQAGLDEESLQQKLGTFVTLKINNQLRGCIGNLEPSGTVVESIRRNAVSSAFNDHRFAPLGEEEFANMHIDISILTEAKQLNYQAGDELTSLLCPGRDGVILGHGRAKATFLPQVWDQLPEPDQFLDHLCVKAGLPRMAWRDLHPDIYVYQVEYFEEAIL